MSEVTFLFMFHMNIVIVEFRNRTVTSHTVLETDERRQSCDRCVSGVVFRVTQL